jgi:phenylpropionate dioxygenase-like ring-hydroxylating dioxygenase large terminal subunit
VATPRSLLPPFPNGWYALAFSSELRRGDLRNVRFMGQEMVLFRTAGGAVSVMDAYCPHLGAHMGHGGRVEGETLRCPFHGFCYDVEGRCVSTPYGKRIPPKARAGVLPVREVHGLILAYHDAEGRPPAWEVPALDMTGWSPLLTRASTLRGHPQETTENSVDLGHFSVVHGYSEVQTLKEAQVEGAYLNARYAMVRGKRFLGRSVRAEFEIHVHGLGYSFVEATVPGFDLAMRQFVLATPTDGEHITLRLALSLRQDSRPSRIHPLLGLLPRALVNPIVARQAFAGFTSDAEQDFEIWQHKRHVTPPILAEGDGPVGRYRQWARQFSPGAEALRRDAPPSPG